MTLAPLPAPRDAGLEGSAAWERSLAEPHAVWNADAGSPKVAASVQGRLAAGLAVPHVVPKFTVSRDDVFFCIGSCFAREIEQSLLYREFEVTSLDVRVRLEEVQHALNGFLNKFTTASMLNELHWALGGVPFPEAALVPDTDGYRDLQLAESRVAVSIERARERRAFVFEYFGRLRRATVVIITLGLAEVWFDRLTGLYLNCTPTYDMVHRFPGRFTVHVTDYTENRRRLEEICDLLAAHGPPGQRIVITVSPVPLHRTFTAADVLVANGYAKSTLRAVAGDVCQGRPNVEYFPSYELVTTSERSQVFFPDQVHVTHKVTDLVTATFLATFGVSSERRHPEFREVGYLLANPDVRAAVAAGSISSGYAHWLRFGRAENRPLGD